jgi:catechol 2,3-dioxygenase-like lactoylglutathione lyase family enzyme
MLGHLSICVRDLPAATRFYDAVLAPIGWIRVWTGANGLGYGPPGGDEKLNVFVHADAHPPGPGFHLCFNARSDAEVDAFHAAARANGGTDNGAPGLRPHYGPDYYAAFVVDPEGWKLEALHKASWD